MVKWFTEGLEKLYKGFIADVRLIEDEDRPDPCDCEYLQNAITT